MNAEQACQKANTYFNKLTAKEQLEFYRTWDAAMEGALSTPENPEFAAMLAKLLPVGKMLFFQGVMMRERSLKDL
jgi:hypothetical protein